MEKYDVIVIGGGPAGIFAAINISRWHKTVLLEKNDSLGKKLLMSGAGKCNLTNTGDIEEFLDHYGENAKFIRGALKQFTNKDMRDFFLKYGMETIEKENGKVFPASESSRDVLDLLTNICEKNGITVRCNEIVVKVEMKVKSFVVHTRGEDYIAANLIVATGGKSYPVSGSSGDGYKIAEDLGHSIVRPKPSLTPVFIKEYKFGEISGVSLQKREIYLYRNNKKIGQHCGDVIFTHGGISGPGILDFSRHMENGDLIKLNMINQKQEKFIEDFINAVNSEGKTLIKKYMKKYEIPESLIKSILSEIGLDYGEKIAVVDKKQRTRLAEVFCEYPLYIEVVGGFNIAMATTGGVSLKDVSPKTMESKKIENLYFVGEVLDIDGDTGGYNIQAAFSTGYAAALGINNKK